MKEAIKMFDPVIYPRKVWVAAGDPDKVISKFKYSDGGPLKIQQNGFFGVTFGNVVYKKHALLGVLIYIRYIETPSQAMHEAIHAANKIFRDLNINYTLNDDEHFAYFAQWICECIESFWKETNNTMI